MTIDRFLRVSAFVAMLFGTLTPASTAEPTKPGTPPAAELVSEELADYHDRLVEIMRELRVPGLAVVVVKDDKVVFLDTLGVRDPETNKPVTKDTIFYIASCTKTFVATAIVALAEDGKLDMDAPVKRYLPRFELADAKATESITIRDLLTHAKGINSDPIVWLDAYTGEITEDRYYRWLREAEVRGSPEYTNVHFTLLGRVIESVTGKSWKDYLQERIFDRAGMTRTTAYASRMYGDGDAAIPSIRADGGFAPAPVRKNDSVMHAAGGTGASINDLARWVRLQLGAGSIDGATLLPEPRMSEMHKQHVSCERGLPPFMPCTRTGFGLSWTVGTFREHRMLVHGGGYAGTAAAVSFLPDKKMGVAVLANVEGVCTQLITVEIYDRLLGVKDTDNLPDIKHMLDSRLAKRRRKQAETSDRPVTGETLSTPIAAYAGVYENNDWGAVLVENNDGRLAARQGALTLSLRSTGKDRFEVAYGTGEPDMARFEIDKNGKVMAIVVTLYGKETRFPRRRH